MIADTLVSEHPACVQHESCSAGALKESTRTPLGRLNSIVLVPSKMGPFIPREPHTRGGNPKDIIAEVDPGFFVLVPLLEAYSHRRLLPELWQVQDLLFP